MNATSLGSWSAGAGLAWQCRLDVPPVAMHASPEDRFLLVGDVFGVVRSLDPATGAIRWSREFGINNVSALRATTHEDESLVLLEDGRLVRLRSDGTDRWEVPVGALRSGFDATADGSLVALAATVHRFVDGDVQLAAEIALCGAAGERLALIPVPHPIARLRFTSEAGDLVAVSTSGEVTFVKDRQVSGQADLRSSLDGLVTCQDGSTILLPSEHDGIHVLSAAMESLGVLEVPGGVEDVDVSEDGSRVLVKERDGLVYLLDAGFAPRWRGRLERPVLRVDLARDGRSAYLAESTGQVLRLDFQAPAPAAPAPTPEGGGAPRPPSALVELPEAPRRPGLARILGGAGAQGFVVVLRPGLLCRVTGDAAPLPLALPWPTAHVVADPRTPRLVAWSSQRLALLPLGEAPSEVRVRSASVLTFCPGGEIALGTGSGEVRRYAADGTARPATRVGAGVVALAALGQGERLVALCADGQVSLLDDTGSVVATRELAAPTMINPDVVAEASGTETPADASEEEFWSRYGRAYRLAVTTAGPVLYHGGGRLLRLDAQLGVAAECQLGREVHAVHAAGDRCLAVDADGLAILLSPALVEEARFALGTREARPVPGPEGLAGVLDAAGAEALLRDLRGDVLRRFTLPGPAEALAVAPDGRTAAALVGREVALLDLAPDV